MGKLLRLGDTADVEPGLDVLDALEAWLALARAGVIGRPLTAMLILEDSDGLVHHATATELSRCDLARKLGLLELTATRLKMGAPSLTEPQE